MICIPCMDLFDIFAILTTFSALLGCLNYRLFHLPGIIGLMLSTLILSSALIIAGQFGWAVKKDVLGVLRNIDFNRLLLNGMLGFLLFAGVLNVELNELMKQKWVVVFLATGAVFQGLLYGCYFLGGGPGTDHRKTHEAVGETGTLIKGFHAFPHRIRIQQLSF